MLEASAGHKIYYKTFGNPGATPIVFIHGGPGGKCLPIHKTFFDFDSWFIIFYDQRGCGKSTPHAELRDNSTWDLVSDIEEIRKYLNIDNWVVFGGS